jgi:hypothetical protein
MFVTANGVSLGTFYYPRSVQEESFQAEFDSLFVCDSDWSLLGDIYYSPSAQEESFQAECDSVAVVTLRSFVEAVESR